MEIWKWGMKKLIDAGAQRDASGPLYKPLAKDQVRLIHLPPAEAGEKLELFMRRENLEAASYSTLSYVWGDASDVECISVNNHEISIPRNLATGLRYLRLVSKHTLKLDFGGLFWCDAICINQHDILEKNSQVALMQRIYSQSKLGISWLGNDPATEAVMLDIKEVGQALETFIATKQSGNVLTSWLKDFPKLLHSDEELVTRQKRTGNPSWDRINAFASNAYFTRAWIVQEVVFPAKIGFLCGSALLSWHFLSYTMDWAKTLRLSRPDKPDFIDPRIWTWLLNDAFWSEMDFVHDKIVSLREVRVENSMNKPLALKDMGTYSVLMESSNPKDRVFALLSLVENEIEVDYGASTAEVYCNYFKLVLEKTNSLELLNYAGVGRQHKRTGRIDLPSWCPDFYNVDSTQDVPAERDTGRGDQARFSSQFKAIQEATFTEASIKERGLNASGFVISRVTKVDTFEDGPNDLPGSQFFKFASHQSLPGIFSLIHRCMGPDMPTMDLAVLAFLGWMISMYRIAKEGEGFPIRHFHRALKLFLGNHLIYDDQTFGASAEFRRLISHCEDLNGSFDLSEWVPPNGAIIRPARDLLDPDRNKSLFFHPVDAPRALSTPYKAFGHDLTHERALLAVIDAVKHIDGHAVFSVGEHPSEIGLGPKGMRVGDHVVLVHGFSRLMAIREDPNGSDERYQVVGYCIRHDLSPAKALANAENGEYGDKKTFTFY